MTGEDITGRPWAQLPKETGKAYAAFVAYLELGTGRSIAAAAESRGTKRTNIAHWQRWSSRYHWVERARAFDSDQLQDRIAGRKLTQETGRQLAIDDAQDMLRELRDLSRGHMAPGQHKVKTNRDGKPIMVQLRGADGEPVLDPDTGEPVNVPVVEELVGPKVRAKILIDLLGIGGVMAPIRVEATGADGTPLGLEAAVASWDPEVLAAMIAALGLDL